METNNLYYYKAIVDKVIDGDTLNLRIDLGFKIIWDVNCRLAGINTPELKSPDPILKEGAHKAKEYVETLLKAGDEITIKSKKLDKYGRPVVEVYYSTDGIHLNTELLFQGLAKIYK